MGHLPLTLCCLFAAAPLATAEVPVFDYVYQSIRGETLRWSHEAQGLAHDEAAWFVTQRHQVWRFPASHDLHRGDLSGVAAAPIPVALRARGYDHFGDPAVWNGRLLIPLEGPRKQPLVAVFATGDLRYLGATALPHQRKAPWIAVDAGGVLYSSNSTLHRESPIRRHRLGASDGAVTLTPIDTIHLRGPDGRPLRVRRIQGGVLDPDSGQLVLVSNTDAGGLLLVRPEDGTVVGRQPVEVRRGFPYYEELEGVTWWDLDRLGTGRGRLHLVMLDNNLGTDSVYLKHFR